MDKPVIYTSVLRVGYSAVSDERALCEFSESLRCYKNSIKEVVFIPNVSHDLRGLEHMRETARTLQKAVSVVREMGYDAGINIVCTIGHHIENADDTVTDIDYMVTGDGNIYKGHICPVSEKSLRYISELYAIFAELNISLIYSDDDLDYGLNCMCGRCLNLFEKNYHCFAQNGMDVSIANFRMLESSPDFHIRKKFRESILDFYSYRQNQIYRTIEKAVHTVNPDIRLGFMTCEIGSDGCGAESWARSLEGAAGDVHHRPGGGVWTDYQPRRILWKAARIGRQIRYLPDSVTAVQAELENHPATSLRKSARFLELEALSYLAAGCTGIAMGYQNIVCWSDCRRYAEYPSRILSFAEELTGVFGRSKPFGAGFWWDRRTFACPGSQVPQHIRSFSEEIFETGIPDAYDPARLCVVFLDANAASVPDDAEILHLLSGGVLMDAQALTVLNERGFGAYTGFLTAERFTSNVLEHDLDHPLNLPGENIRAVPFEFSDHEELKLDAFPPAYAMIKNACTAEYLTRLTNLGEADKDKGFGSGIFENSLGGRICVCGVSAFRWCQTYPRTVQIKNILRWLSKNTLPAYAATFDRVMLWCRPAQNGQSGAIFVNASFDDAENFTLAVKCKSDSLVFNLYNNGKTDRIRAKKTREDPITEYSFYQIPVLPALSAGYVYYQ